MASYNELLALIDAYINQNGVQAITGQVLNGVLRAMVDQLGRGYSIMGAADPTTDPGTPDGPETWFASVPGTYTNFDGIQIVDGELALLSYVPSTGFSKNTIYEGFQTVQATIDGNVGTPAVGVSYANGILSFDFHNMKGEIGDPAGFGAVTASVDSNIGTPSVQVQTSGPDTAKAIAFQFHNLKGETGVTSVLATVDNTSGNPQCAVSLNGQQLVLNFTGLKGAQGDTGSSVDYPFTIVNNLTTNDATQALSAAMGVELASQVSQLELKVTDLSKRLDSTDLEWEQGSIGGDGAESVDAKRVRTKGYVFGPFSIKLKSGYSIQRIAKYADNGSYISSPYVGGSSGSPYYTINEKGNYRVVVCVTGAGSNILPSDDFLDEVVSTYAFKLDEVDGKVDELKDETITERGTTRRVVENISQVADVTAKTGYNAAPQSAVIITFSALASYDSYYFYLVRDADVWLQDDGQTYLSLCYVKDAYPIFGNDILGSEAVRKRKSENNLPTEASPISLHKGDAIIVTVPSGGNAVLGMVEHLDTFNGATPLAQAHIDQVLEQGNKQMYVKKTATQLDVYLRLASGQFIHYPFAKRAKTFTANEYPSFYDNWGIGQVAVADLSGDSMTDQANLFAIGEAELAVSVPSGLDASENKYVGGSAHGFENIVTGDNGRDFCILVNNQKVAEDAVINLTPVEKVEIIQHTQLCQAYTNSDPWADATKHWVWEDGKMACTTSVKILRALTIAFSQFGMFCVYRHWLGNDNNDYLTNVAIKNSLPYKVWNVEDGWSASGLSLPDKNCTRIVEYGERGFGFSMSIKSETTKASGGMFIAPPAAAYNKIYFDMGRSFTPEVGDVLEATQIWEIYK